MFATAHLDTFVRDRLPPREQWPVFYFDLPELRYPQRLNCASELLGHVDADAIAIRSEAGDWSYARLRATVDRLCRVLLDEEYRPVPVHTPGRLAVRGPTGCRYLADPRQTNYVVGGWNITGDTYTMDDQGYLWYQARTDDMIVSAGYNIAGPEIEAVLLEHPAVAECAVIGVPDADRGQVVKAVVVLRDPPQSTAGLPETLQTFVKARIAPYKYPRVIEFARELPRTATGKLQRFRLRESG